MRNYAIFLLGFIWGIVFETVGMVFAYCLCRVSHDADVPYKTEPPRVGTRERRHPGRATARNWRGLKQFISPKTCRNALCGFFGSSAGAMTPRFASGSHVGSQKAPAVKKDGCIEKLSTHFIKLSERELRTGK